MYNREVTAPADLSTVLGDLVSVNHRITRLAASVTGSTESPAVWRTLSVLRDLGPMRLGELARVSRVSQPTMTKLVHTLDERGGLPGMADGTLLRARLHRAHHGARHHQHLREVPQQGEGALRWLPSKPALNAR